MVIHVHESLFRRFPIQIHIRLKAKESWGLQIGAPDLDWQEGFVSTLVA